jgi:hypothetical protein
MKTLKYLAGYSATVTDQVYKLVHNDKLAEVLLKKYPAAHNITSHRKRLHNLDITTQRVLSIPFGHRLHQLLLYQPGRGVTHAQLPFKVGCRQPGFGLVDQINCQEPNV